MKKQLVGCVVVGIGVWAALVAVGGAPGAWAADPPTPPVIINANPSLNLPRIKLSWVASVDGVTPPASMMYCIQVAESGDDLDDQPDVFCVLGTTSHVLSQTYGADNILRPLEPGTTYFIRIQAYGSSGNVSPFSEPVAATTILRKTLRNVSVEEAKYIRDVLLRQDTWKRSRGAGVNGKPLIDADYSYGGSNYVSDSDWRVDGSLKNTFVLQGLLAADDQSWKPITSTTKLSVWYKTGTLTAQLEPVDTSRRFYSGKVKGVTGFSRIKDHDSHGIDGFWGSSTSFEQTTTTTASVIAWGMPYYVLPYLTVERIVAGQVKLTMGHRWYAEGEITEQVTGVNRTDVTIKYKKKVHKVFSHKTKTKTVNTTDLAPFNATLTINSAGSGLTALLSIDTSRPKMDLANPGKIFPPWNPMEAILSGDLDWSVTVDTSPLQLFISDHGSTAGAALEGEAFGFDRWTAIDTNHYQAQFGVHYMESGFHSRRFDASSGLQQVWLQPLAICIHGPTPPVKQWTVAPVAPSSCDPWTKGPGAAWLAGWLNGPNAPRAVFPMLQVKDLVDIPYLRVTLWCRDGWYGEFPGMGDSCWK